MFAQFLVRAESRQMLTMNSDVGNPINVDFQECYENVRKVFLDFLT